MTEEEKLEVRAEFLRELADRGPLLFCLESGDIAIHWKDKGKSETFSGPRRSRVSFAAHTLGLWDSDDD